MREAYARKPSGHRAFLLLIALILQLSLLVILVLRFQRHMTVFYVASIAISVVAVMWILNGHSNPAYKIAWIVPIMLFPVFGGLFYLVFGRNKMSRRSREKMAYVNEATRHYLGQHPELIERMGSAKPHAAVQASYIQNYALYPPHADTSTEYLVTGEVKFDRLRRDLEAARSFIFLEYFIIEEGLMWNSLLDILVRKAAEGVDVRLIYDDLGCVMTLPRDYAKYLEGRGVKTEVFNPLTPILSLIHNNRDHRKIAVIDGVVGFTGGINLADEYINEREKYGHWKDSAVRIEGRAVRNMTVMFLAMWNYLRPTEEDFSPFLTQCHTPESVSSQGFVQPFADSPLDFEPVGQTVYLNLITKATRNVFITTPYLILDHEMTGALCAAAKGGVDVRIITPYRTDKWYVQAVTRANYRPLLAAGVRIFEYTPGFIHSKTFAVDDEYAVVGTINLDYRSLFLHFECAVWMFGTECVADITRDFLRTMEMSEEVSAGACESLPWHRSLLSGLLQLLAPLM